MKASSTPWPMLAMQIPLLALLLGMGTTRPATATESITITQQQQSALGILVGNAERIDAISSLKLPGEIILPVGKEFVISAAQAGLIDRLYVAAGQQVQRGQPVAHLSSQELVGLQRDYLQAQTRQRLFKENLDRDALLFKEDIIAKRRLQTTQAEFEEADAALQQARQSLRIAGFDDAAITRMQRTSNMGSGTTLTTPISGQVIEQHVNTGQRVDPAMPLFKVADLSTLWLSIHVPVDAVGAIRNGAAVNISPYDIQGKVIAIVRNTNRNSQTVQVRAEFKDPEQRLVPGQFVEAQLQLDKQTAAANHQSANQPSYFRLPRNALARHAGKTYVFSKIDSQHFEPQLVNVVAENDDQVTIQAGSMLTKPVAISGIATLKAAWMGHSGEE